MTSILLITWVYNTVIWQEKVNLYFVWLYKNIDDDDGIYQITLISKVDLFRMSVMIYLITSFMLCMSNRSYHKGIINNQSIKFDLCINSFSIDKKFQVFKYDRDQANIFQYDILLHQTAYCLDCYRW